jgi:hypothetical protein
VVGTVVDMKRPGGNRGRTYHPRPELMRLALCGYRRGDGGPLIASLRDLGWWAQPTLRTTTFVQQLKR